MCFSIGLSSFPSWLRQAFYTMVWWTLVCIIIYCIRIPIAIAIGLHPWPVCLSLFTPFISACSIKFSVGTRRSFWWLKHPLRRTCRPPTDGECYYHSSKPYWESGAIIVPILLLLLLLLLTLVKPSSDELLISNEPLGTAGTCFFRK